MPSDQPDFDPIPATIGCQEIGWDWASPAAQPNSWLIVSDAPESVGPSNDDARISSPGRRYVSAHLRARNTGQETFYQGAARDYTDASRPDKGVPPIRFAPTRQGVQLLNSAPIEAGVTDFVFPNATGGAATLPCELLIGISDVTPVPSPVE